ncbi:MAG TPA: hypothetical protein VLA17_00120, partial [Candidatus Limnocylindria bacterium]|nr:hypothetical protein [Candidatus Limnocylindria bacterium]
PTLSVGAAKPKVAFPASTAHQIALRVCLVESHIPRLLIEAGTKLRVSHKGRAFAFGRGRGEYYDHEMAAFIWSPPDRFLSCFFSGRGIGFFRFIEETVLCR